LIQIRPPLTQGVEQLGRIGLGLLLRRRLWPDEDPPDEAVGAV
jgi:hypothetical protein